MIDRFDPHTHTEYSNIRLIDCINKLPLLVERAHEIGLKGIAITDHECISQSKQICDLQDKYTDGFKIAIGNEIYLTDTRSNNQKYYHFILIAKDKIGHKQLKQLSSRAWMQSYMDRGLERVPTLKCELEDVVRKNPGHLIATSACLGGELSSSVLEMLKCRQIKDIDGENEAYVKIMNFLKFVTDLFNDDFYIECAPGASRDQIMVNKKLLDISKAFNIPMVIGTDAHYLKKEDRFVHASYLNSKDEERETEDFYEYAYLQTEDQILENLNKSIAEEYEVMCKNSMNMFSKIQIYDLRDHQHIPNVDVKNYPKEDKGIIFNHNYPILSSMYKSDDEHKRYWVNECVNALIEKGLNNKTYLSRLEEEADVKETISQKLDTNMFKYPITLQHYVNTFWDCGSLVGAGRGSSCSGLNHYLLGITQLDPIKYNLPFYRYLNKERIELGDIDLDLCPSKKGIILKKIKEERGNKFNSDANELDRANLGCVMVATFGTEGTRSAVQTACRGYRSEEYPNGIETDTAKYLSSLVPSERGQQWSLSEVVNGNAEKDRKKIDLFVNEVNKYPRLLDIMFGIEGLVNKRSSHASGVIFADEDPYEYLSYMRTPSGDVITAFDLHDCEGLGTTKYDFLVTEIEDKILTAYNFLKEKHEIPDMSVREFYDEYLSPDKLPIDDEKVWDVIQKGEVLNIFQFDSEVGSQAVKKIKPKTIYELMDVNGLMRLMTAEKGQEAPIEKYLRFKNNIKLWYAEMRESGLTSKEIKTIEPYFLSSYGVPPTQEQLMEMLMDKDICSFTLGEANAARKIVGKKQMSKIPALKEQVLSKAKSPALGAYIWRCGVGPQMGYSFSKIHALAYSFIGFQTAYLATRWNPIYWDSACLVVNSGGLSDDGSTDYAKIAKAIGEVKAHNINVSLVDINKSQYGFEPDVENNTILFGMKALSGVGAPVIEQIIAGRPYESIADFMYRCKLNKTAMISLIKSGAFDSISEDLGREIGVDPRIAVMAYYIMNECEAKNKLTLSNLNGLIQNNLIPNDFTYEITTYNFNKYLKKNKYLEYYELNNDIIDWYLSTYECDNIENIDRKFCILQKEWDKVYKIVMEPIRDWMKDNQEQILEDYNFIIFKDEYNKYASGSISAWEMEAICFYFHEHELINVDTEKYGIVDFNTLSYNSDVESYYKRKESYLPVYKISLIAGTVISKDDMHHSIALLTTTGVVTVKFSKEFYALFNRQLSDVKEDGHKTVMEKSWFTRGTKLLLSGYRREDTFVSKVYKSRGGHQIYKIINVNEDGSLDLTSARWGEDNE